MPISQDYIRQKVQALLPKFGDFVRNASVSRVGVESYDPMSQTADRTVTNYPCRVVLGTAPISVGRYSGNMVVEPTDLFAYAFDLTVDPKPNDRLSVNGRIYDIILVQDISSGGAIAWELVIR